MSVSGSKPGTVPPNHPRPDSGPASGGRRPHPLPELEVGPTRQEYSRSLAFGVHGRRVEQEVRTDRAARARNHDAHGSMWVGRAKGEHGRGCSTTGRELGGDRAAARRPAVRPWAAHRRRPSGGGDPPRGDAVAPARRLAQRPAQRRARAQFRAPRGPQARLGVLLRQLVPGHPLPGRSGRGRARDWRAAVHPADAAVAVEGRAGRPEIPPEPHREGRFRRRSARLGEGRAGLARPAARGASRRR